MNNKKVKFPRSYSSKYKNDILYIVRVLKDGTIGNSQPCDICCSYLLNHEIRTIIYSDLVDGVQVMKECRLN